MQDLIYRIEQIFDDKIIFELTRRANENEELKRQNDCDVLFTATELQSQKKVIIQFLKTPYNMLNEKTKKIIFSTLLNESLKKHPPREWYSPKNNNACFWLACRLSEKYNNENKPFNGSTYEDIYNIIKKIIYLNRIGTEETNELYSEHTKHKNKYNFNWIDENNIEDCKWLNSHIINLSEKYNNKIPYPEIQQTKNTSGRELKESSIIYFYSCKLSDSKYFDYLYKNIRQAWNQRNKRLKDYRKKQCNFTLEKDYIAKIDEISKDTGMKRSKVIEYLIDFHNNNITPKQQYMAPRTEPIKLGK